ncbi:SAM-dependent tRNA/rRNA cytosine-C5 methylase, partial [Candidatus Woesearchaeota archaeon]|nr:SAM-dependent tRNA/rRNA cytosine-C5 methylase [Candidatus Woesearchaeota archaeon]
MSFLSRYAQLGEEFDPQSITVKPALRANTLRTKEWEIINDLKAKGVALTRIPNIPHGYWYEAGFSLGATPAFLQGRYYLQEAASQLPPLLLDPQPGETILDMAAAPGSKTTQLAQLIDNQGVIVALDTEVPRLKSLQHNLERMGVTCAATYKKDARYVADLGLQFDRIL